MTVRNKRSPTISIVINTLNRGPSLNKTLESFRWLRYSGEFEVIVVNGPSTDDSEEVIARWAGRVRAARCPVANLSVSRNIGICLARGEIVAFIDDDAIPEPEWLEQLAAAYDDPQVGAAGGFVFDHTGYDFQAQYCVIDRFGHNDPTVRAPMPHLSYPKSLRFPHLLGANSSFKTAALLEIGGFDEEFEYFLDETDVCARIVDAGYLIAQLPNAYVHHKFAPSNIRGTNRIPRNRYPIVKNKIYFILKHAREFYAPEVLMREQATFVAYQREEMSSAHEAGLVSAEDLQTFERDVERAIEVGLRRGAEGPRPDAMIDENKRRVWTGNFLAFVPLPDTDRCTLVLVSKGYPPDHSHGIATFSRDLAEAYAARGNIVHVIAQSPDIDRVDFEGGVWVHRIVPKHHPHSVQSANTGLPAEMWNWSASAHAETMRIATHRKVDVVEAPIWDCEGAAFLFDRQWPLVTSLHTTHHFWLDSHPEHRQDPEWMARFSTPVLKTERMLMEGSDAIRANSRAIRTEIEQAYGFEFDDGKVQVIPHGLKLMASSPAVTPMSRTHGAPVVLFVGRLEARKGIDVLLDAIPRVLEQVPSAVFRIIGDKSQASRSGKTYAEEFLSSDAGGRFASQVRFEGHVDAATLSKAYAECDLFVAPSRFESFGLVFLEAMRAGKPVIGCSAGGMPEVIEDGVCGLLVPPGDAEGLAAAILRLLQSEPLRHAYGEAASARFRTHFSVARMAAESAALYQTARGIRSTAEDGR